VTGFVPNGPVIVNHGVRPAWNRLPYRRLKSGYAALRCYLPSELPEERLSCECQIPFGMQRCLSFHSTMSRSPTPGWLAEKRP